MCKIENVKNFLVAHDDWEYIYGVISYVKKYLTIVENFKKKLQSNKKSKAIFHLPQYKDINDIIQTDKIKKINDLIEKEKSILELMNDKFNLSEYILIL